MVLVGMKKGGFLFSSYATRKKWQVGDIQKIQEVELRQTGKQGGGGLPGKAHLVILREAMSTDNFQDAGIHIGTTTGQSFHSRDSGDSWSPPADFPPPIHSVDAAVVQE